MLHHVITPLSQFILIILLAACKTWKKTNKQKQPTPTSEKQIHAQAIKKAF